MEDILSNHFAQNDDSFKNQQDQSSILEEGQFHGCTSTHLEKDKHDFGKAELDFMASL